MSYLNPGNAPSFPSKASRCALVGAGVGPLAISTISPAHQTYVKVKQIQEKLYVLYTLCYVIITYYYLPI